MGFRDTLNFRKFFSWPAKWALSCCKFATEQSFWESAVVHSSNVACPPELRVQQNGMDALRRRHARGLQCLALCPATWCEVGSSDISSGRRWVVWRAGCRQSMSLMHRAGMGEQLPCTPSLWFRASGHGAPRAGLSVCRRQRWLWLFCRPPPHRCWQSVTECCQDRHNKLHGFFRITVQPFPSPHVFNSVGYRRLYLL